MKYREPLFYYPVNEKRLLVNAPAFKLLETDIEYAVISRFQDVYVLDYACHRTQPEHIHLIQNGESTHANRICKGCINRLNWATGNACSNLMFIKKEKYTDFSYLIETLGQKKARLDAELSAYVSMKTRIHPNSEDELEEMTYKRYRALLAFVDKLSNSIDRLHRLRGILRKLFR